MPLWRLYFNKISLYSQSIIVGHPIHSNCNFGTNCPKPFSLRHGSGWYIPRRRISFRTAGSCQPRVRPHRRFCGGLPLTDGPGCSISWRCGGGISSRAAPFSMTGKGRGIGLNINGGLLMNFTNSPYERMMKEIPHKDIPAPQKAPEGTPCAGCPYWREIACVFCYQERLKKQS